jgi:hypothetical protein
MATPRIASFLMGPSQGLMIVGRGTLGPMLVRFSTQRVEAQRCDKAVPHEAA